MASVPENTSKSIVPNLVIVCVQDHPKAVALLRAARKRAIDINGIWRAVFIETPLQLDNADEGFQQRMMRLLALARQMGGETVRLEALNMEKGIVQLLGAEKKHLALLVLGDSEGAEKRLPMLHASPLDRIIRLARKQHVAIEIVPLSGQSYQRSFLEKRRRAKVYQILYGLLAVAMALLWASVLEWSLPPALFRVNNQNVGLLFMIACAFASGRFGLLPGLAASVASFLIVNYYFTIPYHALKFNNVTDTINMMLFLLAAVVISLFSSQTRGYAERAARQELNTQALFTLYRLAANASSRKQALEELQRKLTGMLAMEVAFFLPPALNPDAIEAVFPVGLILGEEENKALRVCWKEMKTAGFGSTHYSEIDWRFEPMVAPGGEIGVLGIKPRKGIVMELWFEHLLTAIADQTASVLEHIEMESSMEATRIREEREKLRSMLLSSVSHDLKTPLASIIGALNIYRSQGKKLDKKKQEELIDTALEEAERLDSFITNILDMTHLESGKIEFKQDWHDPRRLIQQVVKRMGARMRQHEVIVHDYSGNIEVFMDAMVTGQVIQNVLENAGKYTPSGSSIEVTYGTDETKGFYCSVRDHGAGLPPAKLDSIFDKYSRLQKRDSQVAGTGLGLAICRAIMSGQKGSIIASNDPAGGAVFTLWLPQWRVAVPTVALTD